MGDLKKVVKALDGLLHEGNDLNKSNEPCNSNKSNESYNSNDFDETYISNDSNESYNSNKSDESCNSDDSNESYNSDNSNEFYNPKSKDKKVKASADTQSFFCVEDALLSADVKVSVDKVGSLSFPIREDIIKKLIGISNKAKFGKVSKTVLDTDYRDTQTIPADKLKIDIDKEVLNNLLKHLRQALNLEDHVSLEIHLYNMLIYGPGQFFKRHQDTEKIPNMIGTLIMVLPSPHKGGELIIEHNNLQHRFFGSLKPEIIKCIAFYSDCFHEVKKVEEGYRVAVTYNIEIKYGPLPDLMTVDESVRNAVNNYFKESKSDMLVFLLEHQYTEHSLKWNMLKGADCTCGKALLAVGKQEGYSPCLALADYHKTYPEDCPDDSSMLEEEVKLKFWIDENDAHFDSKKITVPGDKICFLKSTKKYKPYDKEVEGYMGNYSGNVDEWYHRSAVVLWRDTWSFQNGYKKEFRALHQLSTQPGKQGDLLKKIKENSDKFFASSYWDDESVRKMGLEIMIYLNDKEITPKILSKYKPSEVLDLAKNEMITWIETNCDIETWEALIKAWESAHNSKFLLQYLLQFLLNYMTKEKKDLKVAGYLLDELAKFFMNPIRLPGYSYLNYQSYNEDRNSNKEKPLLSLLQLSHQLGKLDLEKQLVKNIDSKSSAAHFKMFEKSLNLEQFARISGDLLLNMANAVLRKVKEENYCYARLDQAYIQEICTLLKTCSKVKNKTAEEKIFNHIMSDSTCTASFLADLFLKMKEVLGKYISSYTDFNKHALKMIQAELERLLKDPNDCSLPIKYPCSCEHCVQVQRFFASGTSMEITIRAAEKIRTHIQKTLMPFIAYLPIAVETIRSGSPFKLLVTKLPKLMEDKQNYIDRLIQAAQIIPVKPESIAQKGDGAPAPKKQKNQ